MHVMLMYRREDPQPTQLGAALRRTEGVPSAWNVRKWEVKVENGWVESEEGGERRIGWRNADLRVWVSSCEERGAEVVVEEI